MVATHAELSAQLRDALLRDAADFVDELYDVEGIEDEEVRALVVPVRDETKAMFARARAKVGGASVEIVGEERRGDRYITRVQLGGGPKLEIIVDDVYERGGGLRTRELIDIQMIG